MAWGAASRCLRNVEAGEVKSPEGKRDFKYLEQKRETSLTRKKLDRRLEEYDRREAEAVEALRTERGLGQAELGQLPAMQEQQGPVEMREENIDRGGAGSYDGIRGSDVREQNRIIVSENRLQHSVSGEFNSKNRLINGGHGQANLDFLKKNNIKYNIVKEYSNGVRVGNIPNHKNKNKRVGTGQAWFPENWTDIDIRNAGEYIANISENMNIPDGVWIFGNYKGVRVGIIKNNGEIGTIVPDNSKQP